VPAELRFAPRVGTYREAEKPKKLFGEMGYHHLRSSYHMLINMDAPVPDAELPEGITLRTFNSETDAEAVYHAENDSFRDHFGYVEQPFEEGFKRFRHFVLDAQDFDPTLLFLAMDGNEVAGINICQAHSSMADTAGLVRWVCAVNGENEALVLPFCVIRSTNSIAAVSAK
jgi:hypothetical protein